MNQTIKEVGKTILHVEDCKDHADLVRRSLSSVDVPHRIVWFPDGEKALEYLRGTSVTGNYSGGSRPSIILLDLRLPSMDGLEVLRMLKSEPFLRTIPVVVLSSSSVDSDISRAYELGASSFIVKPVGYRDLSNMMANFVRYWLVSNRVVTGDLETRLGQSKLES